MNTSRIYRAIVDESTKTAIINVYDSNTFILIAKYITNELSNNEIVWLENSTSNDVYNYLKTQDNYKKIL